MGAFIEGKVDFKTGTDARIRKYYELLEENEALQKKIRFLQEQINQLEQDNHNLYWFGAT